MKQNVRSQPRINDTTTKSETYKIKKKKIVTEFYKSRLFWKINI